MIKVKPKSIIITLAAVLVIAGAVYLGYSVVKDPSMLSRVPLVNKFWPAEDTAEKETLPDRTEVERLQQEIADLRETLAWKESDITYYKNDLDTLQQRINASNEEALKAEIIRLNAVIADLQTKQKNQDAAYQDLAEYYTYMKNKEAAAILSQLSDEDAIGILTRMDNESAAGIMQSMATDKAAVLTRKMLAVSP